MRVKAREGDCPAGADGRAGDQSQSAGTAGPESAALRALDSAGTAAMDADNLTMPSAHAGVPAPPPSGMSTSPTYPNVGGAISQPFPCAHAPLIEFTAAGDCHLVENVRACVEQHLAANAAAFGASQHYPPAAATHQEVLANPDLFQKTLDDLNTALGTKISKIMRLGGQELNLHLLYQRVRRRSLQAR
jgi:hypothetical protein